MTTWERHMNGDQQGQCNGKLCRALADHDRDQQRAAVTYFLPKLTDPLVKKFAVWSKKMSTTEEFSAIVAE